MKKRILFLLFGLLGFIAILALLEFFYLWPLYEDKSVKTEMDMFSTQGGVLFYHEKYSSFPPTLELMFKTVGNEACWRDSVFPDQYSGKQTEAKEYNGQGGWVYNPEKKLIRLNCKPWHPPYKKYILHFDAPKADNKGN